MMVRISSTNRSRSQKKMKRRMKPRVVRVSLRRLFGHGPSLRNKLHEHVSLTLLSIALYHHTSYTVACRNVLNVFMRTEE